MAETLRISDLSESLLAVILSYCSAADLVQILELKNSALLKAAKLTLSNTSALHCSFLLELGRCANHGACSKKNVRRDQEECVVQLLRSIQQKNSKLERIEFGGLLHLVGNQGRWLSHLFQGTLSSSLTSIDFSGCAMLDPMVVQRALVPPWTKNSDTSSPTRPSSILRLNFQGCYRIDAPIVMAIAKSDRFAQLQSLGLGGCSQTIGDECVHAIITHLKELKCLDLSGLKHITEQASVLFQFLPEAIECLELGGCELLRFSQFLTWGRNFQRLLQEQRGHYTPQQRGMDFTQLTPSFWKHQPEELLESNPLRARYPLPNLTCINFNGLGTPRRGLVSGALPYFALRSMGALREVHLSGCEHVQDWEVEALAIVCANSLTCLEMRACCIGDDAVRAVGLHCTQLTDVDFSACFQISDEGMMAFCQYQGNFDTSAVSCTGDAAPTTKRRRAIQVPSNTGIKSLKVAALPQVTNDTVRAIAALDSLILLDISNCPKVTSEALGKTVCQLKSLVDVDAKGIGKWSSSVAALYSYEDDEPRRLRFVNGRRFQSKLSAETATRQADKDTCYHQCLAMRHGKRLNPTQGVPLQPMYHCLDCKLTPSMNRGVCHACMVHCHKGHRTFTGSLTRFYCDCPFGIAGTNLVCQTITSEHVEIATYGQAAGVYT